MTITESARGYEVHFDYRPKIVAELKEMAGFRYQGPERGWFIPISGKKKMPDGNIIEHFQNKPLMEKFKAKYIVNTAGFDAPEQVFKINDLPELKIELPWRKGVVPYYYQNFGIARGLELKRFINGDQPGLGKSMQAIGTVLGFEVISKTLRLAGNITDGDANNPFPCLVICPATLKENWRREIEDKFSTKRAIILNDKNKANWHSLIRMGMGDFIIINFESLWSFFIIGRTDKKKTGCPKLSEMIFDARKDLFKSVIIDELHKLKDPTTRQSKVTKGLTTGKEIIIGLTGTPVVNKPMDLLSQLYIINQMHRFGGGKYFKDRYCQGGTGSAFENELNGKLNNICFFRREKKDVLKDLPDKVREIITCDITTRAEYNLAKNYFVSFLKQSGYSQGEIDKSLRGEVMVQIQKLKEISGKGKLPEVIEQIQEMVDADQKVVVFIYQKFMANALQKEFPKSVCVRGTEIDEVTGKEKPQSAKMRQMAVDAFQACAQCGIGQTDHDKADHPFVNNEVNPIICSLGAGGVGLTLTAASTLFLVEWPWHSAQVEQIEDRIHRIGQKDGALIKGFLGKDTIDEKIYEIICAKRDIADAITGTTTVIDTTLSDLTRSLFNQR